MKLKDLVKLPPIIKVDCSLPVVKKLELMARNKTIREIGEIEVDERKSCESIQALYE